ncbi:hypothetical protein F3Y22_tig00110195pilonHSYRG00308 [Hibiscus syriacus]|uniref:DC1 domain-containing protein n=1 Tax=Hibiscus syriacus TaxID=106335 RepID=A0A6A3BDF8_HIBSY|nr:hypothetical protein F3Y22_tig00110195pilonHSYRG00308 [Hibiscus syriacus]
MLIDVFLEDYSDQYYCDVCEEERKPRDLVYCCNKCTFVVHIECALNEIKDDANSDDESTCSLVGDKDSIGKLKEKYEINERNVNMSTHFEIKSCERGDKLIFYEAIEKHEKGVRCSVCWLEISYEAYACRSCRYYIHKTCIRLPSQVLHPLHPQHSLKLIPWYAQFWDRPFICEGCRGVNKGFAYVCYACGFKLDVKCATSSLVPRNETQRLKDIETQPKLCVFNKHHKLVYVYHGNNSLGGGCSFCGLHLSGPSYICYECGYSLHESCVGIPWEMQIQFHPLHPLHPLLHPSQCCLVCKGSLNNAISYSCMQCDLYLHVHCATSLKRVIKSKSHIHDLYYFGPKTETNHYRYTKVCGECKGMIAWIPFCFCMECDTKLHIERVLPRSLKSKYHIHPLTRKDGFKEDDSGEYYCDICEEERDVTDHVYHCTECRGLFVAHEEEIAASSNSRFDSCPLELNPRVKLTL